MTSTKYSITPQVISTIPDSKLRTAVLQGMMQKEELPSWLLESSRQILRDMIDFEKGKGKYDRGWIFSTSVHFPCGRLLKYPFSGRAAKNLIGQCIVFSVGYIFSTLYSWNKECSQKSKRRDEFENHI